MELRDSNEENFKNSLFENCQKMRTPAMAGSKTLMSTANHRRKRCRLLPTSSTTSTTTTAMTTMTTLQLLFSVLLVLPLVSGGSIVLEGSQTSYAQFRQWDGGPNSTLEFEFKTSQASGLLLYTDNPHENEYMLIKLVDGSVRLRFNWGDGAHVLTAKPTLASALVDNKSWHKVSVIRSGEETVLIVGQLQRESHRPVLLTPRVADDANVNVDVGEDGDTAAAVTATRTLGRRKDNLSLRDAATFGNASTNSYVFIGGLPSWYGEKPESVVLPTILLEPRFRGSIRKLKYKDTKSEQPRLQDMMAYKVMCP